MRWYSRWVCMYCFFFFSSRRRHTRSLRDWSSDVCSSDLTFTATVEASAQAVDAASGTTRMLLVVDNQSGELMTGAFASVRSEERRVGKECRSRWSPYH